MDTAIIGEKADDPDADIAIKLSFPKARQRKPSTRADYQPVTLKLIGDEWSWQGSAPNKNTRVSPTGLKFKAALARATGRICL